MSVILSLNQIVEQLGGEVSGNADIQISKVGSLALAQKGSIGFFSDTKYTNQLNQTDASAVILNPEHAELTKLPKVITDNPYAYFAQVSQLLNPNDIKAPGIHVSSTIHESCKIPENCSIGPNVVIEANVSLGEYVVVGAGSVIEKETEIGEHTVLEPNVTIKHHTKIGAYCHLFSGCVIGNDGFGYAETADQDARKWVKIPQVGRAIIHDHVDVGSNTTIDRGAIDDTVIEDGVKIDNLVQIAHNCRIGAHTVIAGCVGIAGSAVIGKHCKLGGAANILGHLSIADDVTISPDSMITRSIRKAGTYTALMPFQTHNDWLKTAANIRQLSQLSDKIKALEAIIKQQSTIKKS